MRFTRMLGVSVLVIGITAISANAGTIDLVANAYDNAGNPLNALLPGAVVTFEVGVTVQAGNMGLATIVYNVLADGSNPGFYQMNNVTDAESGWSELPGGGPGVLNDVSQYMYVDNGSSTWDGYNGGWGFDTGGLPHGGNVTMNIGSIMGPGLAAPLAWDADVNTLRAGLQPKARLGVGQGTYTFPAGDPAAGGLQGGFGQDLTNVNNIIPGDGTWLMQRSTIDTSGWATGTYVFTLKPTNGAVFTTTLNYNVDQGGGFRVAVTAQQMGSDTFSFTLVPEPATLGVLLIGGLGLVVARRRR